VSDQETTLTEDEIRSESTEMPGGDTPEEGDSDGMDSGGGSGGSDSDGSDSDSDGSDS
jgi:hypothetical protein